MNGGCLRSLAGRVGLYLQRQMVCASDSSVDEDVVHAANEPFQV